MPIRKRGSVPSLPSVSTVLPVNPVLPSMAVAPRAANHIAYNPGRYPHVPVELDFVSVPIDSVRLDPMNPRKNDMAAKKLAPLLRLNGFRKPISVDQDGVIRAGNTAWKAAKILGMTHIPAVRSSYTTERDKVNYTVSDNEAGTYSEWDDEILMQLKSGGLLNQDASGFNDNKWKGLELSEEMPPALQEVEIKGDHKELGDFIVVRFPDSEALAEFKLRIGMGINERAIEAAAFISAVQGMTAVDTGVPF